MTLEAGPGASPLRHLARRRRLARLALGWERLWPALWPPLGVFGLFMLVALLGLPLLLPPLARPLLTLGFLAAIGFAGWRGFRGVSVPGATDADRRLEAASGLAHRPLAALSDRPAGQDPMALALWEAHRRRATASIRSLRVGIPHPGLARRDPIALRTGLSLALIAALVMAGPEAPERLRRALLPSFGLTVAPPSLRLEAWVTPPAYTGAAPIFLDPAGGELSVPQGSKLQVALSGGTGGAPDLLVDSTATPFRALDARSWAAEAQLDQGSHLSIQRDGEQIAGWVLTVQADQPPVAAFTEAPARASRGLALRLPWRTEDDWGVAHFQADIRLVARPQAPAHAVEINLPSVQPKQATGTAGPDLSSHPWAGLEVSVQLLARDGAGQEGRSAPVTLTLPERAFAHPVAQALVALRKALSLDPSARPEAIAGLEALSDAPEAFEQDTTTFLALRSTRHRLELDRRPQSVDEAQQTMWEMALALEEGRAERTARALEQAIAELREALERAIQEQQAQQQAEQQREQAERQQQDAQQQDRQQQDRQQQDRQQQDAQPQDRQQNQPQTGEQREQQRQQQQQAENQRNETDQRIQQLRDAIRRHLEAMAERLQQENAESMPTDPQNRLMNPRDLDRRTDRMREANRENRPRDAERELAELEQMLRDLEQGRNPRSEAEARQRQQRQRGQQQMGVVQDMVRRQTRMLDSGHQRADSEAERREADRRAQQLQNRAPWARQPPNQEEQRQQQRAEAEAAARAEANNEARTQRALRRALGEVMQQFGDLAGEVPAPLGRADQAMRQAQEALSQGGDARTQQQTAIRELQEGGRQMAQQMQQQFGQGQEGEGEGEGQMMGEGQGQGQGQGTGQAQGQDQGRDPLGRRTRESPGAQDSGSDTRVPEEAELLRTRRIQEELRKRGAERSRTQDELDYIDRLLKRF